MCFCQPESFGSSLGTVCLSGHVVTCPKTPPTFLCKVDIAQAARPPGSCQFLPQVALGRSSFSSCRYLHTLSYISSPSTQPETWQMGGVPSCLQLAPKVTQQIKSKGGMENELPAPASPFPCLSLPPHSATTRQGPGLKSNSPSPRQPFIHQNTLACTESQLQGLQTPALPASPVHFLSV